jgi:hypothetical protein
MKNYRAIKVLLITALVPGCALLRCVSPNSGGTETGDGKISAMLHNPGGSPAAHAKVIFYPVNYNPHTGGLGKTASAVSVDSTTTNDSGNFTITLPVDTYTMQASGDSGLAYQDSIKAVKDSTVRPDPDTLKPAGSIKGIVRLEEGGDPTTVFILFMGTHTFTFPDDTSGSFTSDSMAAGTYRVRILTTTPNYKTLDTTLRVIAGTQNVMPDTIWLKYTGIPTPRGLTATYDTVHGIVTVRWNRVTFQDLQGYIVYRNDTFITLPERISGNSAITDTFFNDTIFHDLFDTNTFVYEYRVKVQDKNANIGDKFSTPFEVTAASPTEVRTFINLTTINTINDSASTNDSVKVVVSYRNQTRYNNRISWYVDRKDSLVKERIITSLTGNDTLMNIWRTPGDKKVFVKIQDTAGTVWEDSIAVYMADGKWVPVGLPGFSIDAAGDIKLVIDNGVPFVAFNDGANGNKVTVMKYDGSAWSVVGTPGFSSGGSAYAISLAVAGGVPYVVYEDDADSYKATVMKYDGSAWVVVGTPGLFAGGAAPAVVSIATIDSLPYLAFSDYANGGVTVLKYNGSAWDSVGTRGFTHVGANSISMVIANGIPCIAYNASTSSFQVTVMKYESNAWITVGSPNFSAGQAVGVQLAISDGIPYVAYSDEAYGIKATVMKYNGSTWVAVGTQGFSADQAQGISLAISNGTPYAAYQDGPNGKATVEKYNGSAWVSVGQAGISGGAIGVTSLAISNGVPYVAFSDVTNNGKATVMRLR